VCIAVWLILAGRTIPSKLAGLVLPITAFITLGFEHSIANFYLIPAGLAAGAKGSAAAAASNLIAVTLGNLVGGVSVAGALWLAYLRAPAGRPDASTTRSLLAAAHRAGFASRSMNARNSRTD
jgi:formate/nitrite transporter FocA (FNT family)